MCGLAGVLCRAPGMAGGQYAPVVERMCRRIAHRGPDDEGIWHDGPVCLGSRRLAIQDLSPAGHMPMVDPSGRFVLAYNGELYNAPELRRELEGRGVRFRSTGDTEVVLHSLIVWGDAALARFAGILAFAFWDNERRELWLVRDQLGVKPLYYLETGDLLLFASEIKALLPEHPDPRVDEAALIQWSLYRNLDFPNRGSLVRGIEAVLPGEIVKVVGGVRHHRFYFRAPGAVDAAAYRRAAALPSATLVREIEQELTTVVREQLVSDVPVGTLLSGGLDSSVLTAIAARYRDDLTAFHVSIAGFPEHDERPYAETLCRQKGLAFVPLSLDGRSFRAALAKTVWLSDLPLTHPNSVAYHLISRVVREHGVIVALAGEGADELFGGYAWAYRRRRRLQRLRPWLQRVPAILRETLALLLYAEADLPVTSIRFRELLPPTVLLLDRFQRREWLESCTQAYGFVENDHDREILGAMLADLGDFLSPLLRRLDRMSMGASVECRVPFLDPRLVVRAVNLPLDYKVGRYADKWILKQVASRHLPRELVFREKMGFPLPLWDWTRPYARPDFFARGFLETRLGFGRRGLERLVARAQRWIHALFGLITLEIWGRLFLMGRSLGEVEAWLASFEPEQRPGSPT
ncbi:MAG: asparagine synthase (glutamine-hydrolyzing) [Geminicoccaceae bacterium]|nr:asparagine synthase (glutamine-hydrolyzing) [Geminicoccaceae bacterium]